MDLSLISKVLTVSSLAILVMSAAASYKRVTRVKFILAVLSTLTFFSGWIWIDYLEAQKVRPLAIAMFAWLSLFVFVIFALSHFTGRGLFAGVSFNEGLIAASRTNKKVALALKVSRHLLIWPVVAIAIFFIAKGLSGHGWVTQF
jgi:hypothetical protein